MGDAPVGFVVTRGEEAVVNAMPHLVEGSRHAFLESRLIVEFMGQRLCGLGMSEAPKRKQEQQLTTKTISLDGNRRR